MPLKIIIEIQQQRTTNTISKHRSSQQPPQRWRRELRRSALPESTALGMWSIYLPTLDPRRAQYKDVAGFVFQRNINSSWRTRNSNLQWTIRSNADGFSPRFIDTVPPSESRSRRWKSHSTPSTSAHSAERQPSRDTLWESGTASHARRPSLEEHTPSRTLRRPLEQFPRRWSIISSPTAMTDMNQQNPRGSSHAINAPTIEGNCWGLEGLKWIFMVGICLVYGIGSSHGLHASTSLFDEAWIKQFKNHALLRPIRAYASIVRYWFQFREICRVVWWLGRGRTS